MFTLSRMPFLTFCIDWRKKKPYKAKFIAQETTNC